MPKSLAHIISLSFIPIIFAEEHITNSPFVAIVSFYALAVLEWGRTRESGSESESTGLESESESESVRPESESIRCESESIGPESESESIAPESESESESSGSESESESTSPTEVRVSPDSAWTHESNNRKVLYFNPTFNHFCWALYW